MRAASIAIHCEVVESDPFGDHAHRHRKMIFRLSSTGNGEPIASNELAVAIRNAAAFVGVTPDVVLTALVAQMNRESDKLARLMLPLA